MWKIILVLILVLVAGAFVCFAEAPSAGCVVVYGDSRTNHAVHQKIVDAIVNTKPGIIFLAGDLVNDGYNAADWETFNRITSKFKGVAPLYPALGNHERHAPLYFKDFTLPNNERWYALDYDGIHFIVLDGYSSLNADSLQYQWLKANLHANQKKADFIIVIVHQPIFSTGKYSRQEYQLRAKLAPLFEKYKVDIVFSGHEHDYERSQYKNTYYLVTGGGGAPLYDRIGKNPYSQLFVKTHHFCQVCRTENQLVVKVLDSDLKTIDEFIVPRKERK